MGNESAIGPFHVAPPCVTAVLHVSGPRKKCVSNACRTSSGGSVRDFGMGSSVLLYDGDCGVCTLLSRLVTTAVRSAPDDFRVSAYQDVDLDAVGLSAEECDRALQWVSANGRISSGQDAVAKVLLAGRLAFKPLGAIILVPGMNAVAGVAYRWVALNRHRLPGGTPACSLPAAQRPS